MFSLTTVIVVALVALITGSVLGALLAQATTRGRNPDLEERLARAESALNSYQRDVTEHFSRTTELVNSLTESYREMHEHLANSALKLSTAEVSRQLLDNDQVPGLQTQQLHAEHIQAPRDWAPKPHGSEGTLSEGYGLDDNNQSPQHHTDDSELQATPR